jgi:hypothetical protein
MSLPANRCPRSCVRLIGATAAAVLAGLATLAPAAHAASRAPAILQGFTDHATYQEDAASRAAALSHTRDARARFVRITIGWLTIEPQQPPSDADAADPSWPGYQWKELDAVVRDVAAAGLEPLVSFTAAPAWAEGPNRPPVSDDTPTGTWRPSPDAYRLFARAAAARYSGHTPDPLLMGAVLPRVRYWQPWNEPNLTDFLTPQWETINGTLRAASPNLYRLLNNAFYDGVKSVSADNFVATAGTAPYGEAAAGARRIPPASFVRRFLCVTGRTKPRPGTCATPPAKFDALAHHPYPITTARAGANNPDDVVVGDMTKITRPLRVAERAHLVAPAGHKQVWATELSWDTNPPDPNGIPTQTQARYVESALYVLWQQGVHVAVWYLLRDEAPGPRGFPYTLQSGVFFRGPTVADDRPKPSFTAVRFPLVIDEGPGRDAVWGIAPQPGSVSIQRRNAGGWTTIRKVRAASDRLFLSHISASARATYRAAQGSERSLTWRGPVR